MNTLNMKCIPHYLLIQKYGLGEQIGKGGYGEVYLSRDKKFVIKSQLLDVFFIREINILSNYKHPNIIEIADISINDGLGFMVLPIGKNLEKTFLKGEITLQKIITDLFNGLLFLSSRGIAHCDLKDMNCVVIDGTVKIIDFGLAKFCTRYNDEYYFHGVSYTKIYRDPEFNKNKMNPINVELFSLSATIFYLLTRKYITGQARSFYFDCDQFDSHIPDSPNKFEMISFLMECQEFLDYRKNIEELSEHFFIKSRVIKPSEISLRRKTYGLERTVQYLSDDIYYRSNFDGGHIPFINIIADILLNKKDIEIKDYVAKIGVTEKYFWQTFCDIFNRVDGNLDNGIRIHTRKLEEPAQTFSLQREGNLQDYYTNIIPKIVQNRKRFSFTISTLRRIFDIVLINAIESGSWILFKEIYGDLSSAEIRSLSSQYRPAPISDPLRTKITPLKQENFKAKISTMESSVRLENLSIQDLIKGTEKFVYSNIYKVISSLLSSKHILKYQKYYEFRSWIYTFVRESGNRFLIEGV